MNIFCTLFDSHYLSRGLTMYESLKKNTTNFKLYIFCFDDDTFKLLTNLNYQEIKPISLSQFEDEKLLQVKSTRNKAEYCWTSTSSVILYVLNNFNESECTYLDADLYFFNDPSILLEEAKNHSVMITEHRFTKKYKHYEYFGIYNVQFMYFKNDEKGLKVLNWWREKCLEWCFDKSEDGKFGDQKYLDKWTTLFDGVHVMTNKAGGVAPWNVQTLSNIKTDVSKDIIFYHFHKFKIFNEGFGLAYTYDLSKEIVEYIYSHYYKSLIETTEKFNSDFSNKGFNKYNEGRLYIKYLLKRKTYNGTNIVVFDKNRLDISKIANKPLHFIKNIFINSNLAQMLNKLRFFIIYR